MNRYLSILAVFLIAACTPEVEPESSTTAADRKPVIYTVNYPLAWMAQRIAGDAAEIRFPAPSDVDPAYWSPGPEIIAEFQSADLILLNGAGYARWVALATLPQSRLVNTSEQFRDRYIPIEDAVTHAHGPGGEHAHTDFAITTWLDPQLALQQAQAIAEALIRIQPDRETGFREQLRILETDLRALDARLAEISESLPEQSMAFSHPVYQYLRRRYGLDGFSVHWEPDTLPTTKQWREFEEQLKKQPAHLMLWEDEPLPETASRLRTMGVEPVVYRPLANRPAQGDFLGDMQDNIERLAAYVKSR